MSDEEILQTQRLLRGTLLDNQRAMMPGAADLVAHLLLYLEDTGRCWQLTLDWIRQKFDADRSSGGFASPWELYRPQVESIRTNMPMPASVGQRFDCNDPSMRSVWTSAHPLIFDDIAQDRRFSPQMRASLLALNMGAKFALALRDRTMPVGLICCDWVHERARGRSELYHQLGDLASQALSPVLLASRRIELERECARAAALDNLAPALPDASGQARILAGLTAGELAVARLAVTGMSYKEIALRLNRSFSTIEHRLRSMREKLCARSTARMICMLSELLATEQL